MTRTLLLALLGFSLCASLRAQETKYTYLSDAVRRPAAAKNIELHGSAQDMERFAKNASKFTSLEQVKIREGHSAEDWKPFFHTLASCSGLRRVEFSFNQVQVMPETIRELRQVETISIWGNEHLNYSDLFDKLAALPNLKTLELNGTMQERIPESIGALQQLQCLSLGADDALDGEDLMLKLRALPALKTLRLEMHEPGDLPENIRLLAQVQRLELRLLRETEDKKEKIFTDELSVQRPDDPARALRVVCSGYGEPLSEQERIFLRSITLSAQPATAKLLEGKSGAPALVKQYSFIKPPIAGVDVPHTTYTFEANAGGSLSYPTGTVLNVPADAFVDAAGNKVSGPVKIDYREFRDPVDFIASGIPMTYDSGGVINNFQSAGMFEINASVQGKEVFLADGKDISLDFALTDSAEKYSFYKFDDEKGNWTNIGNSGTTRSAENAAIALKKTRALPKAWTAYQSWQSRGMIQWQDTTQFADRFGNADYFYTKRVFDKKRDACITTLNKRTRKRFSNRNLVRLTRIKAKNKGETWFKLEHWSTKHPELNAFTGVKWICNTPLKASEFRKKFGTPARFSDIRIIHEGEDQFTLQLKGKDGVTEISATAYVKRDQRIPFWKNFSWRWKYYSRQLARRERRFNKELRKKQNMETYYLDRKDSVLAWKMIRSMMSPEELAMEQSEWMGYCRALVAENKTVTSASYNWRQQQSFGLYKTSRAKRAFNVAGNILTSTIKIATLGVFNCDCLIPYLNEQQDNSVKVLASYQDTAGRLLRTRTTYILNREYNGMLTYNNERPGRAHEVRYGKVAGNLMLSLGEDGSVHYFSAKDFKREKIENGMHTFNMRTAAGKVSSAEDLRKLVYAENLYEE